MSQPDKCDSCGNWLPSTEFEKELVGVVLLLWSVVCYLAGRTR